MEDEEIELSNHEMESFIDELLKDTHACTHIHTCNPPGPDNSHTHTCFHVHTKLASAQIDDSSESVEKEISKKRPLGNREAVRKYRQKKKARTASMEDEVIRLKALNQQLLNRLQAQAVMEAEVARLKCLLVDIRGRIEGEIGCFPYKKPVIADSGLSGSYRMNPCDVVECGNEVYCHHNGAEGKNEQIVFTAQGLGSSDFETLNCFGSAGTANSSGASERKGADEVITG